MGTRKVLQIVAASTLLASLAALVACGSETGLAKLPDATFAQLECYDTNGDHVLNDLDAADPAKLPDFDNNGKHDADDAAFFKGIDIPLNAQTQADGASALASRHTLAPAYSPRATNRCRPRLPRPAAR